MKERKKEIKLWGRMYGTAFALLTFIHIIPRRCRPDLDPKVTAARLYGVALGYSRTAIDKRGRVT